MAQVVSIEAWTTYDIWVYGVVVYEAIIAGLPLSAYACRGKHPTTSCEIAQIGLWDEHTLRKALKHVSEDEVARDLLKRHHDPEQRISSL